MATANKKRQEQVDGPSERNSDDYYDSDSGPAKRIKHDDD